MIFFSFIVNKKSSLYLKRTIKILMITIKRKKRAHILFNHFTLSVWVKKIEINFFKYNMTKPLKITNYMINSLWNYKHLKLIFKILIILAQSLLLWEILNIYSKNSPNNMKVYMIQRLIIKKPNKWFKNSLVMKYPFRNNLNNLLILR